jgi:hypothetical protein
MLDNDDTHRNWQDRHNVAPEEGTMYDEEECAGDGDKA